MSTFKTSFKDIKIPQKFRKFVEYIEQQCIANTIALKISTTNSVNTIGEAGECSGWFDYAPIPTIAVATGKPATEWVVVLAHEYCHATQWMDQCDAWTGGFINGDDVGLAIEDWLMHKKEFPQTKVKDFFARLCFLELDNERRTVKMLKQFKVPVDIPRYCQRAGSYVMFYNIMPYTRKWYTVGKEPYNTRSIWTNMPKTLNGKYNKVTPKILKLYSVLFPELTA